MEEEHRLIQERQRKLKEIRDAGINPYPYRYDPTHTANAILEEFKKIKKGEKSRKAVSAAGRIMQLRRMGRASFCHVLDSTGKIQLYFNEEETGKEGYRLLKKLDLGDIIGAEGKVFRTKTGEITVYVKKFQLLAKSIRPLPEKFHGLKDVELRYRQRYVDLIMNPEVREVFVNKLGTYAITTRLVTRNEHLVCISDGA